MIDNINAEPDYGDEPPFACSSVAVFDGEAFACGGTPGHAGKHRYLIEWDGQGAIAAQDARPEPGDASAIVDGTVKEWLDRRTATALATAPGIDDREQGKRQGIEQLRYLHLDDYWYVLTPAILAALGKEPKPAPELAEPVTVAGVPYSDYPSLVAAMQAEIDRERTARLHMAGERDEARSGVARVRRAILASGKTHQWKIQQLLAIVGEIPAGEPEQPAPELAAAMAETRRYREQFEALRAELLASAEKSHPSKKSEIERSVARTIARILDGTK